MRKVEADCYHERIRRYEEDKRKMKREHPEYTAEEYKKAIDKLADKWRI